MWSTAWIHYRGRKLIHFLVFIFYRLIMNKIFPFLICYLIFNDLYSFYFQINVKAYTWMSYLLIIFEDLYSFHVKLMSNGFSDCGNKPFLFPLRLAWLQNDQSWGGQNTGNPHPRSATQTGRDMDSSSGNLSSTLVHKTVKEAPLVVWYDQLVPFLGLQAETLECVILDEGESVI